MTALPSSGSSGPSVLANVLQQHVAEIAILWNVRRGLTNSGVTALRHLARFDRRIAAHHDGCVVAGTESMQFLLEQLTDPTAAALFALAIVALEIQDRRTLERCVAVAETIPNCRAGVASGLGWVSSRHLMGIGKDLLSADSSVRRRLGLAACRYHAIDPGPRLIAGLEDADVDARADALRTAGVLGRYDLASECADAMGDDHPDIQFCAAWSAVVLGNAGAALDALTRVGKVDGPHRPRAFRLSLQALKIGAAHHMLQDLATDPRQLRWVIQGTGIVGDPTYVPWLISHMKENAMARIAGEAFSLIAGLDLALVDLERKPPEDFESGPNDDPDDPNVDMDEDDGLPWPDPQKIEKWWVANEGRFQKGTRYFMGAPVTREHSIDVLRDGYQRQRILAAHYLCLLEPGTPLFNTSAPAWRQQRLLAKMT